jgi:hypothetical protein
MKTFFVRLIMILIILLPLYITIYALEEDPCSDPNPSFSYYCQGAQGQECGAIRCGRQGGDIGHCNISPAFCYKGTTKFVCHDCNS